MTQTYGAQREQVRTAMANVRALTPEEAATLLEELNTDPENRGYGALIAAENWHALAGNLHSDYTAVVPAHSRDRDSITKGELQVLSSRLTAFRAQQIQNDVTMSDLHIYVIDRLLPRIAAQDALSLTDQEGALLMPTLLQLGLISQEQLEAFTKEPAADTPEGRPARIDVLFGADVIIEPSDLEGLF